MQKWLIHYQLTPLRRGGGVQGTQDCAVLEVELRASHLLGRHSTSWVTPPSPFFCVEYFQNKVLWIICQGWLQTSIFLISASWVAKITAVSHPQLACFILWDRMSICSSNCSWTHDIPTSASWVLGIYRLAGNTTSGFLTPTGNCILKMCHTPVKLIHVIV
jgi:hypothetical protein